MVVLLGRAHPIKIDFRTLEQGFEPSCAKGRIPIMCEQVRIVVRNNAVIGVDKAHAARVETGRQLLRRNEAEPVVIA